MGSIRLVFVTSFGKFPLECVEVERVELDSVQQGVCICTEF